MSPEPYPKLPVDKPAELKDAYEFDCAGCGHNQMAAPSMMMTVFGLNSGSGGCLGCGAFLHLYIAADNTKIISELWPAHVERMKALGQLK